MNSEEIVQGRKGSQHKLTRASGHLASFASLPDASNWISRVNPHGQHDSKGSHQSLGWVGGWDKVQVLNVRSIPSIPLGLTVSMLDQNRAPGRGQKHGGRLAQLPAVKRY